MKGLDDFITGRYHPNNPENQTDWTEEFSNVLDHCDWITDELLDKESEYQKLESLMEDIWQKNYLAVDKYYSRKEKYQLLSDNAEEMATQLKEQYFKMIKSKK